MPCDLPCFSFRAAPLFVHVPSPLAKIMERMQESLYDLLGVEGIEMDPVAKVSIVRDVCEVKRRATALGRKLFVSLCWWNISCVQGTVFV